MIKNLFARLKGEVREWLEIFQFTPHFIVVATRQALGRWYYMRDRPMWFVNGMADLPAEQAQEPLRAIILEARAERGRRREQGLREIEKINHELAQLLRAQGDRLQVRDAGSSK